MSFSQFTQEDFDVIAREYASLRELARKRTANDEEMALVDKAFDTANKAHVNVRRRSGEPYILHPIAVSKIVVSNIGLGCKSICAALLHDVVEDTDYTVDDIRELFGDKIASLVDGLTKIKNMLDSEDKKRKSDTNYYHSVQAENLKRILLTLNDDIRVVLIKLADRLHNCRTIEFMPEYKRDKILSETMFIFIPLAHRLGMYEIKSEMENIWLRYKEPEAYNDIMENIARDSKDKGQEIDDFLRPIDAALRKAGIDFHIRKRLKSPYSIWHKMRTKNVTFEQVYDLYAVRIVFTPTDITKEREECFKIFSIVTGIYRYREDRFRDWVRHPKSNGYEALHVTLLSESGIWVEVQIRTQRMDDIAEKGIAAHWAYKKDGYMAESDSEMDKWLEKVKCILVNPDVNALSLLDFIHNDLVANEIVVFTPRGEQKSIQNGATALDFAFMVHSDIGGKAIAAKVNRKLMPLSYVLRSGDQVEIITAEDEHPKKEWLQFLKTRQARNLVLDYFKTDKETIIKSGTAGLELVLDECGITPTDKVYKLICSGMGIRTTEDLFFRFALGMVSSESVKELLENYHKETGTSILPWRRSPKLRYVVATCCNPIAGDPVIGFSSPGGTITVHKKSCPIAEGLAAKHGEWIVKDPKLEDASTSFLVRLTISGIDKVGLLNEVTRSISLAMELNIKRINMVGDKGIFEGYIDLWVSDRSALEQLIGKLENIDGIQKVVRTEKNS